MNYLHGIEVDQKSFNKKKTSKISEYVLFNNDMWCARPLDD